jgi:RES domain
VLYRVFPARDGADPAEDGGPLFVARALQGSSRHDNPDRYGALYATRVALSAVAERLLRFRGQRLSDADLVRADGRRYTLAEIDDAGLSAVPDLDDPQELVHRRLRPSWVATGDRSVTQPIALQAFEDGSEGFAWWSTIEAGWSNVTLFAERVIPRLRVGGRPDPLTTGHPLVRAVAERLGIGVGR